LSYGQTQPMTTKNFRTLLAIAEKIKKCDKSSEHEARKRLLEKGAKIAEECIEDGTQSCLAVVWLGFDVEARTDLSRKRGVVHIGDVGLAVNIEPVKTKQQEDSHRGSHPDKMKCERKICEHIVDNLLRLLTLGSDVKVGQPGDLLNVLYFVGLSPHYPYAFIPVTFHEEIEEHRNPNVVATIHRLAKRPLSMLLIDYLDLRGADTARVELDPDSLDQRCEGPTYTFLASALASMLTAKTRRGYYLSLVLVQSLPLFLKCGCSAIESYFPDVFATAVEFIY